MIDRQERRPQRDSVLFALGLSGALAVELLLTPEASVSEWNFVYASLFGCSTAVMFSGVFRATNQQVMKSAILLGIGFGIGAIVNFF
jgi:hypothetical protein